MTVSTIKDRIERMRSGGVNGPSPTGFLLSVSEGGNALLIVHDLGLPDDGTVLTVAADGKSVRLTHGGRTVLQAPDTSPNLIPALVNAPRIEVLEMDDGEPLRLHPARLGH